MFKMAGTTVIAMALLGNALLRTASVAKVAGARALLVHALNEKAAGFYQPQAGYFLYTFAPWRVNVK